MRWLITVITFDPCAALSYLIVKQPCPLLQVFSLMMAKTSHSKPSRNPCEQPTILLPLFATTLPKPLLVFIIRIMRKIRSTLRKSTFTMALNTMLPFVVSLEILYLRTDGLSFFFFSFFSFEKNRPGHSVMF